MRSGTSSQCVNSPWSCVVLAISIFPKAPSAFASSIKNTEMVISLILRAERNMMGTHFYPSPNEWHRDDKRRAYILIRSIVRGMNRWTSGRESWEIIETLTLWRTTIWALYIEPIHNVQAPHIDLAVGVAKMVIKRAGERWTLSAEWWWCWRAKIWHGWLMSNKRLSSKRGWRVIDWRINELIVFSKNSNRDRRNNLICSSQSIMKHQSREKKNHSAWILVPAYIPIVRF